MKIKTHICSQCGTEKLHGSVCVLAGERGMRWICKECIEKMEPNGTADKEARE